MSGLLRDPQTRHCAGFDRWDFDALAGREVCCSNSNAIEQRLGPDGAIWWWDQHSKAWFGIGGELEEALLAEVAATVEHTRRAVPVIRLFASASLPGEREAAFQGLVRLARALNNIFRSAAHDGGVQIGPENLYSEATASGRWLITSSNPPPYSEEVFLELQARWAPEKRAGIAAWVRDHWGIEIPQTE